MAGSIKGIIVEIGGDTSGLQKALSKVNSVSSSLSKELRGINSLLKLDPKNAELLRQKQDVLNASISTTQDKLKQLQNIKDEADKKMSEGTEVNEENYRALQREIIKTQNKLSDLKNEASNWNKAGKAIQKWGDDLQDVGSKIDNLGTKLTTRLTLPIAGLVTAGLKNNAEIEKYTKSFETFLGNAEKATQAVNKIKEDSGKTPFDVTSLVQANQMLISTGESADGARETILALGDAVTATGGGNDELTRMAANLQQVKNAGVATALDIKQFAYAGIDIYGLLADYTGKSVQEVKDMKVSYEDLTGALKKANKQGGKYFNAMSNSSETLTGQINQLKAETKDAMADLTKSLMPTAKKVIKGAKDLIGKFDKLSDSEKENIVKIGLMVAAAGPLLKIGGTAITTIGKVTKGIGIFTEAIGLAKNGIGSATGASANLAKVFQGLTSPAGIAAAGITAAVAIIVTEMAKAEAETKAKFESMGNGATDFYNGIQSAEGYLDKFNSTLFASTEEQENLKKQMDEVQKGITDICKTASDERRGYTQEEITQLDEYFQKLRELKDREIQIQQQIAGAITQQAVTNAETFQGSLDEYKVQSQEWIATAQQQAETTINLIEQGTIEEVALLNQKYGEEATMQNEAYATEYNNLMTQKQQKIDAANAEVAEVMSVYSQGYAERANQDGDFYEHIQHYNWEQEQENQRHADKIKEIGDYYVNNVAGRNLAEGSENEEHYKKQKKIWENMYKNMSESEAEQLGVWIAMLANTEMYGGDISEENQQMVDTILESYDSMPKKTREAMENAMSPMLEEMKKSEPTLWAKASNIANGILSRLKKSFDIHSPSRETRDIFQNVMKGAELGLEDEQKALNKQVDDIANQMKTNFSNMVPNMGAIKQSVIDQTKTVFTTPTLNIYAQDELTPHKINTIIDTVNRRLGSKY